jgi:hypothetical protein
VFTNHKSMVTAADALIKEHAVIYLYVASSPCNNHSLEVLAS